MTDQDSPGGIRPEDAPTIEQLLGADPSPERIERLKSLFILDDPTAGPEVIDWLVRKEAKHFSIVYNSILAGVTIDEDAIDAMMKNVVDVHVHGGSDPFQRLQMEDEIGMQYTEAGMRAFVIKTWYTPSASRVALVQRRIDEFAAVNNLRPAQCLGGITLNRSVGGFNPEAVRKCLGFPGMKYVWFPMIDSYHHRRMIFDDWSGAGLKYLDEGGKVIPEVKEILRIIADNDLVLATGHYSYQESAVLVEEARALGVTRISVVHPSMLHTRHTIEQMKEQVERGARLEFRAKGLVSHPAELEPLYAVEMLKEVGAHNFVLGADWGQIDNIPQVVGVRWAIKKLLTFGVTPEEIRAMMVDSPTELVGLPAVSDVDVPQVPRAGAGISQAVLSFSSGRAPQVPGSEPCC